MAKQVASLDHLSDGRVLLGIGAGWNAEEMENHGTAFKTRWKVLRERVLAMREVWREEEAEFHGEYVDFDPSGLTPSPSSRWSKDFYGCEFEVDLGSHCRVLRWLVPDLSRSGGRAAASGGVNYAEGIQAGKDAWQQRGRSGAPEFCIFGVGPQEGAVEQLIELGFDRVVFGLPPADANVVLPLLDQYAEMPPDLALERFGLTSGRRLRCSRGALEVL